MRVAILQMTSGIDPQANARVIADAVGKAADAGAQMLFTPEMCGLLDRDGKRAAAHIQEESADQVLAIARDAARKAGIWVALGSLAIADPASAKRRNRSFIIVADDAVKARYDKIHLFDVDLPTGESWRESSTYLAGEDAVVIETPLGPLGLAICYDMRFPALFSALAGAGARLIAVPAAFTVPTGQAHWHVLLRARAIETQCFIIAAAQTGGHEDGRTTYGHSLVVDPWGRVLLDAGEEPGLFFCDIEPDDVDAVRARIPALAHRRPIGEPLRA